MKRDQLHVLVLPSFYPSAAKPSAGIFFQDQVLALHRAGVRVGVVHAEMRSLRRLGFRALRESHFQVRVTHEGGVPVLRMHGWNPLAQAVVGARVWRWETSHLVRQYVRRFGRPDVVHAHNALWAGAAALAAASTLDRPYVITEHSSEFLGEQFCGTRRRAAVTALMGAASVACVSEALANSIVRIVPGVLPVVIPNVVDEQFFDLPPAPRRRPPYRFLAIGNLKADKGFDVLLRAFAAEYAGSGDHRLMLGGEGPEGAALRKLAAELGVQAQVEFLGVLSRVAVRNAMHAANALVVSSFRETFGVVLVEALATGLPVVATACGGPNDIVTDDVGLLVPTRDVDALRRGMVCVSARSWSETVCRRRALVLSGRDTVSARLANLLREAYRLHSRRVEER